MRTVVSKVPVGLTDLTPLSVIPLFVERILGVGSGMGTIESQVHLGEAGNAGLDLSGHTTDRVKDPARTVQVSI